MNMNMNMNIQNESGYEHWFNSIPGRALKFILLILKIIDAKINMNMNFVYV